VRLYQLTITQIDDNSITRDNQNGQKPDPGVPVSSKPMLSKRADHPGGQPHLKQRTYKQYYLIAPEALRIVS